MSMNQAFNAGGLAGGAGVSAQVWNPVPAHTEIGDQSFHFNVRSIQNGFIFTTAVGDGYYKRSEVYCATAQDIADQVLLTMVEAKLVKK